MPNPKRPWQMIDYPPFTDRISQMRTYATLDAALAKAIIRCMGSIVGTERMVQNVDTYETWRVTHIPAYRVLVHRMTMGPDNKWLKQ
jgi:hypothetical protein